MDSNYYQRKIYALLQSITVLSPQTIEIECLKNNLENLQKWWEKYGTKCAELAKTSDRISLKSNPNFNSTNIEVRHLISGQEQELNSSTEIDYQQFQPPPEIAADPEKTFWWLWRFYPEELKKQQENALLIPVDQVLPDCPNHSYNTTVSALAGAMFSDENTDIRPHLLLFTFSPVQEFIKASRKFIDFWAGSYLLHYLGAKICWYIAEEYGPDAIITPSLWGQEIIDALIFQKYREFQGAFNNYIKGDPVSKFNDNRSASLNTAGFPNLVTAVLPGKEAAKELGEKLTEKLKNDWIDIGIKVREVIKKEVIDFASKPQKREDFWKDNSKDFLDLENYKRELEKWQHGGNWEWNNLWETQLNNTWETYWTVVPLGHPEKPLEINNHNNDNFEEWLIAQTQLSQTRQDIPTEAEKEFYEKFNVGTWWGSFQGRLGQSIQAVKNTRTWQIPVAPGERSTLSGQSSAVYPGLNYNKFQ